MEEQTSHNTDKRAEKQAELDSDHGGEFSCNICFDTSMAPVLTLCGHLFCWSCLHQWLEAQRQNPTCPVCKAGCSQDKVIPIYGRGKEQVDPRSTTPKRPAGQRPEPLRHPGQAGFALAPGQVTFSGTMLPAFMFSPFGIQYSGSYTGTFGGNGAAQTPMQAYMSRMFFMLGTMILFKKSPPELDAGQLESRFLKQQGSGSEYVVSTTAPCPIIDAHVHVFPQKLMDAVWTFFENFYWPVRYKETYLKSRADFLVERGVHHVVLLVYAHKNGIARELNRFLAKTVDDMNARYTSFTPGSPSGSGSLRPRRVASGLGTVMPGEPGAVEILVEAFTTLNLAGIKMHSHVQCVAANDPSMDEVYATCVRYNKPCLIHAGKDPNSAAYKVDAGKICDVSIVEDVLQRFPSLRICVPHLGMNQYQEFFDLLEKYPNLYLDTTMVFAAFFQRLYEDQPLAVMLRTMMLKYSDRIMYGTDWPNVPYDWCRELANLVSLVDGDGEASSPSWKEQSGETKGCKRTEEGDNALEKILWRNACRFYGISEQDLGLCPEVINSNL
ncbi:hypothetical protein BGZ94_005469 [Podila epigama]|nr:hypothetical protein BGZ94_005469 [Podila epigama]